MAVYIIMAVIAYLIGSVNISIFIGKKITGFDIREKGSGSTGATNVLRTVGIKAALLTLICDVLKGVVAVILALIFGNIVKDIDRALLIQIAGIFVILGHTFPVFFKFKGGKGVATSLGILLITNWEIGLICLCFALVIMVFSKMVSMGSVGAAILFPILTIFIGNEHFIVEANGIKYFVFSLIIALIVIFNHRENIKRILNGTENKISFKKGK